MRFSEEKEGGGIEGWNLPFHKVSDIRLSQEQLLQAWDSVQKEGSPDEIAELGTTDVKRYVDEYARSQRIDSTPSELIETVEVRALGDRTFPELVFFVKPFEGIDSEKESLLSDALFPLSYD